MSGNNYKDFIKENGEGFQFLFMAPLALYLIDRFSLMRRLSRLTIKINQKMLILYGNKNGLLKTKMFLSQIISLDILILFLSIVFALLNKDMMLIYFGLFLVVIIPEILSKELDKQIRKKQEAIVLELPEFLNKVALLVNAGETLHQAIIRSVERKKNPEKSYLYKELQIMVYQLKNNLPFNQALEELSKRLAVHEVSIFTTTILLNYRRGSDELVLALSKLSKELWEKRMVLARILGEKASSKLVFPMVLIFIVVLLIIATPSIMLF
ncbi:hypothetical protein BHF71_02515 [Vulcanibacillus modesticaldus]|uniref:Type II secretion system protein GspF domain-containing protein n=1 Tax=Vulcanibacillus modesticaldus TaxID=337097 RepID=A0A1D2YTV4_9BACI|nr:type II secretion system F family protein [Vulcanibacillus modesticaldus]OEF99075.1 hypothetical protein BHF71_02515 [Vulcanibacillus modesticaldus]